MPNTGRRIPPPSERARTGEGVFKMMQHGVGLVNVTIGGNAEGPAPEVNLLKLSSCVTFSALRL
jgi:hypothetical protein